MEIQKEGVIMNFCHTYNKIMKKLDIDFTPVESINIIKGMCLLILSIILSIILFILRKTLFIDLTEKCLDSIYQDKINTYTVNLIVCIYGGLWIFVSIFFIIILKDSILLLVLLPILYASLIIGVAFWSSLINEKYCEYIISTFLITPLEYICNKTTSHCNLTKSSLKKMK